MQLIHWTQAASGVAGWAKRLALPCIELLSLLFLGIGPGPFATTLWLARKHESSRASRDRQPGPAPRLVHRTASTTQHQTNKLGRRKPYQSTRRGLSRTGRAVCGESLFTRRIRSTTNERYPVADSYATSRTRKHAPAVDTNTGGSSAHNWVTSRGHGTGPEVTAAFFKPGHVTKPSLFYCSVSSHRSRFQKLTENTGRGTNVNHTVPFTFAFSRPLPFYVFSIISLSFPNS